jgi:hypothetical protein
MFFIKGGYKTVKPSYTTVMLNYTTVKHIYATVNLGYMIVIYNLPTLHHESTINNLPPVVYRYLRKYAVCVEGNYGYLPRYSLPAAFYRPP